MTEQIKSKPLTALNEYVYLGNSGLKVSPVCLGTMTFGTQWGFGSSLEESKKVYDLYRSKGGNFFDTANMYTAGQSEQFLGQFVGQFRSEAVVATKYTIHPQFRPVPQDQKESGELVFPNGGGNSRKSMVENLDASLKRLGMGYVDIFYVHNWEGQTPFDEVMRGLDDVVRSGKALYVSISDTPAWCLARANSIADLRGWSKFIALQTRYNLCDRSFEVELGPACEEFGMSVCAWGALAEGFLTGKHSKGQKTEGSTRNDYVAQHFGSEKNVKILETVTAIAKEIGRTPGQVALNWVLQRPRIIPIFGAKTVAQLEDNLGALEFTLTPEQMKQLNDVSKPDLPFPQSFFGGSNTFNNAGLKVKTKMNPWLY